MKRVLLAFYLLILAGACASPTPPVLTPTPTSVITCDSSLWQHVYHPYRLEVIEACKTVTGTITAIRNEADGDLHILINTNGGALVAEAICNYSPITQSDAIAPCEGLDQHLVIPPVGSHVVVIGSYVLDRDHGNQPEIHPVSSIEEVH